MTVWVLERERLMIISYLKWRKEIGGFTDEDRPLWFISPSTVVIATQQIDMYYRSFAAAIIESFMHIVLNWTSNNITRASFSSSQLYASWRAKKLLSVIVKMLLINFFNVSVPVATLNVCIKLTFSCTLEWSQSLFTRLVWDFVCSSCRSEMKRWSSNGSIHDPLCVLVNFIG